MVGAREHPGAESIAALMDGGQDAEDVVRHIAACKRCFHVLSEAIEVRSRLKDLDGKAQLEFRDE